MKQISSRFSMAVHILSMITIDPVFSTGDHVARSINSNPVVIRRIMAQLKKAGYIDTRVGVAGATLQVNPEQITLLDIYKAVEASDGEQLFRFHKDPDPHCSVGRHMESVLVPQMTQAQAAMENELSAVTLAHIVEELRAREAGAK